MCWPAFYCCVDALLQLICMPTPTILRKTRMYFHFATLWKFYRKHLRLTTSKHGHFQRLFLEIVRLITLFKSAGFPIQKSLIQNHKDNCFISLQDLTPKFVLDFYIRPMGYTYQRKKHSDIYIIYSAIGIQKNLLWPVRFTFTTK